MGQSGHSLHAADLGSWILNSSTFIYIANYTLFLSLLCVLIMKCIFQHDFQTVSVWMFFRVICYWFYHPKCETSECLKAMHIFYLTVSEVRKCDRSWLDVPAQELWRGAVKSAVSPGPVLLGFNSERFCVSACSVAVGRTWFLGTVGWRPHLLARWMVHSTLAGLTSVGARERRCSANAVTSAQKGTPPAGEGSYQCDHRRWGPLEHLQQLTSQRPTYS